MLPDQTLLLTLWAVIDPISHPDPARGILTEIEDFLANRERPPDEAARRRSGRRSRRQREHAWMMQKER